MGKYRKIVVVGASGLVGKYVVRDLSAGNELFPVVRASSSLPEFESGRRIEIDLEGVWECGSSGLPAECDGVIFLAQSNAYRSLPEMAATLFQGNVVSLGKFLEYAKSAGAKSFVYASTGSVYRPAAEGKLTEASSLIVDGSGRALYPWSKLTGEAMVQSYSHEFEISILRLFSVYGAAGNTGMLIPSIARKVANGDAVQLQGADGCVVTPTYAGDVSKVCCAGLEKGAGVMNVAGPEAVSLREIATVLGRELGRAPGFEAVDGSPPELRVSIDRMSTYYGIQPVSFSEGVKATLGDPGNFY